MKKNTRKKNGVDIAQIKRMALSGVRKDIYDIEDRLKLRIAFRGNYEFCYIMSVGVELPTEHVFDTVPEAAAFLAQEYARLQETLKKLKKECRAENITSAN